MPGSNPWNIPDLIDVSPELADLFARSRALRNQEGKITVDLRLEKGDCAVVVKVDAPKDSLLAAMASWLPAAQLRDFTLDTITVEVVNNLIYIRPIEWGHSQQKPSGFIRLGLRTFANYVVQEIQAAMDAHPNNPRKGLQAGLDMAVLRIQAYLVKNTPVAKKNGGTLKGAWIVRRQDGTKAFRGASSGRGVFSTLARAVGDAATELTQ